MCRTSGDNARFRAVPSLSLIGNGVNMDGNDINRIAGAYVLIAPSIRRIGSMSILGLQPRHQE